MGQKLYARLFFLMIRRPPRSTQSRSSAASDVYKRQLVKELKSRRKIVRKGLRAPGTPERVQVLQDRRWGALEKIAMGRKKKASKRAILEKELPAIIEARKKGYSWEIIAKYIGKQHGTKISRETVRKVVDYDQAQASSPEKL